MKNKPKSVFIATPMYGGMCYGAYAKSLFSTLKYLFDSGVNVQFRDLYNESMVTRARDILTALFLKSGCDYLLFVDADQTFTPQDVERMIKENKDVLGGVVPKKEINWHMVTQAVRNGVPPEKLAKFTGSFNTDFGTAQSINVFQSVEVDSVGTGMMLIKKDVFEALKPHVKKYEFTGSGVLGLELGDEIFEFWNSRVNEQGKWASEDITFCQLWKEKGGQVFAAPWVQVKHIGSYEYSGSLSPMI